MKNAVSTRRYRLRRAIERGDPRLGMIVGLLLSLVCGVAFVRRDLVGIAETLEIKTLDFAFKHRAPIRESDRIALIDIDDVTARELWPIPRENYGQAILALDRLGARQIVFDVQFKTVIPRPGTFDEETGEYLLSEGEKLFRFAIGKSGKVTLAYSFDDENPPSRVLQEASAALNAAFEKNPSATLDEISKATGLEPSQFRNDLERARERSLLALVGEAMDRNPATTFPELRRRFLPDYEPSIQQKALKLIQYSYWMWRCRRAIEEKTLNVTVEASSSASHRIYGLYPPLYPFLERAQGVGCVNAQADSDGVMRRPWTHLVHQGRAYPYLGLEAAVRELGAGGPGTGTWVRPGRVEVIGAAGQASLPVDGEGRVLVNWAGNGAHPRSSRFVHLSFGNVIEFYQKRYEIMNEKFRKMILDIPEGERRPMHAKYLSLSDKFEQALRGKSDLPGEESRSIENKMDDLRRRLLDDLDEDISKLDEAIAKSADKPQAAKRMKEHATVLRAQRAQLAEGYEVEKALRARVEGRVCLIGSASTASGDLHATPLGSSTPGMDVQANVANMALTGQVLRRAPGWVNFTYLFILGLLIAFYVTHWQTMGSAIATGVTIAASGALFWTLFTGPAILVTGAGPVVTAVLTFAAVTAYKELLTQRSKRKLQRELEKNTSAELVKILLEHPEFLSQARRMTGTFFFSDVKSFTSITEKMDAEVLFPFINRYLDRVTQELRNHQAFVDKYIGDGIMALFGIPVPTPDHARLGCKAALDCQAALKPLNAEFKLEGLPEVKMRIGIHSGEVRAGNVGSLERSNYTVLGDNVNLAARLEGANKEYDTSVMISEATWDLVAGKFVARELDTIRVVGKRKPVKIFELLAAAGDPVPMEPAFLEAYAAALALFKDRLWSESIVAFEKCLGMKPGDKPCRIYVERAKVFQVMPPPPDWEGVFELTSK